MSRAKENESLTFQQLLAVVEWLASKDESENEELRGIYRIIHSHQLYSCCKNPHPAWRKEAVNLYYKLLELGEV